MTPIPFPADTHIIITSPADWDYETHGPCADLHVEVADNVFISCWKPSREEVREILGGKPIMLSVVGGQPAVMVLVEGCSCDGE